MRPTISKPEHLTLLRLCRLPTAVADLASDMDLPLGVVRILLSDMRERGSSPVHHPVPTRLTDPQLLREVADGLRRLLSGQPRGTVPVAIKILIAGGFGAGKTTLVSALTEIRPLRTEEDLSAPGVLST